MDLCELVVEALDVLEVLVYGSKAHVGNRVELEKALEHHVTQIVGCDHRGHVIAQLAHDVANKVVENHIGNRALDGCLGKAGAQFGAIKRLKRAVALGNLDGSFLTALIGCEALTTCGVQALAAATYGKTRLIRT